MKLRWYGHACFELSSEHVTVVTDPHDGSSIGLAPPSVKADIVLVSHNHFDHNAVRVVEKPTTKVITMPGEVIEHNIKLRGIEAYHDNVNGAHRGKNILYHFCMDNINFCHLGDLGHVLSDAQVKQLGPVDILFVPVGSVFTIDGTDAWKVIERVKPKVAVPMHYKIIGLSISIQPVDKFLSQAKHIAVNRVGNMLEFDKDDIPEELELWVFSL
jgi:L-ascorbate metabolism protein UlaG (beta-lactamase superfamily)